MVQVGDTLFDGKVVVVSVSNGLVTSVTVDSLKDDFGNPLTLSFNPGITLAALEAFLSPLFP